MNNNQTLQNGESDAVQSLDTANSPRRTLVLEDTIAERLVRHRPLPCPADRQQIIEQASLILAEARAILEQLDQFLALDPTTLPASRATLDATFLAKRMPVRYDRAVRADLVETCPACGADYDIERHDKCPTCGYRF